MSKAVVTCDECGTSYDKKITQSVFCPKCKAKVEKANKRNEEENQKIPMYA